MSVDLVIAGRRIRLHSREGVSLLPDERFRAFTVPGDQEPDLLVEVEAGSGEIPASAAKVFDAQLLEEFPDGVRNTGEPFWEIFAGDGMTFARVFLKNLERTALLVIPHDAKRWQIFAGAAGSDGSQSDGSQAFAAGSDQSQSGVAGSDESQSGAAGSGVVDPLPYPLDGLLLYFLFSQGGDIMIHGSGVVAGGRGWIFTGRSGSGKTTMARIFDRAGDRVIHDDRLVLRREDAGWVMHNTPVYRNDEPRSAPLDHLWVIRHGSANVPEPVAGAEAVAMILANCIQQNWDREAASRLAAAADHLAASVSVSRLSFLPDARVRDYLLLRSTADKTLAAAAVLSMLDEGRSVTVTAGGYSMWPAIRPGDAVVIDPVGARLPEIGEIVALKRDGGYVIHRVTGVTAGRYATLIRTQGDGVTREDEPADAGMIAGVVVSVVRSGRQYQPPPRRLPRWMNRMTATVAGWVRG